MVADWKKSSSTILASDHLGSTYNLQILLWCKYPAKSQGTAVKVATSAALLRTPDGRDDARVNEIATKGYNKRALMQVLI